MIRVLGLCGLLGTAAAPAADDTKSLQGTWVIESATLAGRDHTEDFEGMKLTLDGNNYVVDFGKNTDKGTFAVDPAKSPKQIDLTSVEGPFKGKALPGIYDLKGDTLRICANADGKADLRPKAFEAPDKVRSMLLTFKRAAK